SLLVDGASSQLPRPSAAVRWAACPSLSSAEGWVPLLPHCPYEPRQLEVWPHVDQSVAVEPGCQTRHAPSLEQHELVKKLTPVFVAGIVEGPIGCVEMDRQSPLLRSPGRLTIAGGCPACGSGRGRNELLRSRHQG